MHVSALIEGGAEYQQGKPRGIEIDWISGMARTPVIRLDATANRVNSSAL